MIRETVALPPIKSVWIILTIELWCYEFNMETKKQFFTKQFETFSDTMEKHSMSNGKIMLMFFISGTGELLVLSCELLNV